MLWKEWPLEKAARGRAKRSLSIWPIIVLVIRTSLVDGHVSLVAAATIVPTAPTQFEARRPKIEIDINLVMLSANYCPACCPTILFPYNTKTRQVFLQKLPAAHCNFPIKGIFFSKARSKYWFFHDNESNVNFDYLYCIKTIKTLKKGCHKIEFWLKIKICWDKMCKNVLNNFHVSFLSINSCSWTFSGPIFALKSGFANTSWRSEIHSSLHKSHKTCHKSINFLSKDVLPGDECCCSLL